MIVAAAIDGPAVYGSNVTPNVSTSIRKITNEEASRFEGSKEQVVSGTIGVF